MTKVLNPSHKMKTIYYIYLAMYVVLYLCFSVPFILLTRSLALTFILGIPLLFSALFTAYWIERYYKSVRYELREHEIVITRGVWWRNRSIVPYGKITNIDIVQGPVSRLFGIATLRIQTAGYSSPAGRLAEAEIAYIEDYEKIKEEIITKVRVLTSLTKEKEEVKLKDILRELRLIREILERNLSKR